MPGGPDDHRITNRDLDDRLRAVERGQAVSDTRLKIGFAVIGVLIVGRPEPGQILSAVVGLF